MIDIERLEGFPEVSTACRRLQILLAEFVHANREQLHNVRVEFEPGKPIAFIPIGNIETIQIGLIHQAEIPDFEPIKAASRTYLDGQKVMHNGKVREFVYQYGPGNTIVAYSLQPVSE